MSLLFHCICNTKSSLVMLIIVIMIAHIDMVIGDVHPWAKAMHDNIMIIFIVMIMIMIMIMVSSP